MKLPLVANDVDVGLVTAAFASIVILPAGERPLRSFAPSAHGHTLMPVASVSLRHLNRQRERNTASKKVLSILAKAPS
jgi:hypothetical protein